MLLRFQYIPHSLLRPLLNHDSRVYQLSIHFLFEMRYQQHFDQTCSSTLYHWFSDLLEEHPHLTSCSKSSLQHRFVEVTRLYLCVTYLMNIQRKGVFPESFGIKWEPELILLHSVFFTSKYLNSFIQPLSLDFCVRCRVWLMIIIIYWSMLSRHALNCFLLTIPVSFLSTC